MDTSKSEKKKWVKPEIEAEETFEKTALGCTAAGKPPAHACLT